MKALPRVFAVFGLVVAVVMGSSGVAGAAPGSAVAAIHAADEAWMKAYNAGDLDKVVALYDENAVVYPPGVAAVRGRAAVQTFLAADMAAFGKSGMTIVLGANPEGGVAGDMGWSSGTWMVKDPAGNVVDSGWYFSVSKKVGGKWLYVRDAWNSDKSAAAAPATPTPEAK